MIALAPDSLLPSFAWVGRGALGSGLALNLPRDASAVAFARLELRRLGDELPAGRQADLQLVVTELVTNALVHGRGAIRLEVQVAARRVRGEVADEGGGFAYELRARGPESASGRGLQIVAALTSEWGVHDGRSIVWFEIGPVPHR
jgi:anti-sigma regulatory factor (Ser/Thr protein kinase)